MKDINYIVDILEEIVNIPSPSGYTKQVMERIEKEVAGFGFSSAYNRKGGMLITVPGRTETVLGLSAHVDTLEPWCVPSARTEHWLSCRWAVS